MSSEPAAKTLPRRMRLTRMGAVLVALAIAVCSLAVVELLYRQLAPDDPQRAAMASSVTRALRFLEPCARVEERDGVLRIVADSPLDTRVFDLPLEKPSGTVRIAVVGESTASMLAVAIERLLERSPETLPVDVVNCSSPGSALEHVERRAAEALSYGPDVLVVAFGHNIEMQYPMDETALRLLALRDRSHLLTDLAVRLHAAPNGPRHTDLGPRIAELAGWLDRLAVETEQRGVLLVPMTLGANLWVPPYAEPDVAWDPRFLRLRLDDARGDHERAIGGLLRLVGDGGPAYWHFTLGTWLARQGRTDAAYRQLHLALDHSDTEPDRAPSTVNEAIRRMAAARGLPLRDLERMLERRADGGLPGWDVMSDHCHMQPPLVREEAAALVRLALNHREIETDVDVERLAHSFDRPAMARALEGLTAAQSYVSGPFLERWLGALATAVEQWVRFEHRPPFHGQSPPAADSQVDAEIDAYLAGPLFASIATTERRAGVVAAIAAGYAAAGADARASAVLDSAAGMRQPALYVERGLVEAGRGNVEAAREAWSAALALDRDRADAQTFTELLAEPSASRHE